LSNSQMPLAKIYWRPSGKFFLESLHYAYEKVHEASTIFCKFQSGVQYTYKN
jgi:hypothetical protein